MLTFVLHKLLHKKWLMICLLIGNVLLIGITCCNPMYQGAALQKMLTRELSRSLTDLNQYPATIQTTAAITMNSGNPELTSPLFENLEQTPALLKSYFSDLSMLYDITYCCTGQLSGTPVVTRKDDYAAKGTALAYMTDMEAHSRILMGSAYSETQNADGSYDCIVTQRTLIEMNLLLDEVLEFDACRTEDGNPLRLRIAGVFEAADLSDAYWTTSPTAQGKVFYLPEAVFERYVLTTQEELLLRTTWTQIYDYTKLQTEQVDYLINVGTYFQGEAARSNGITCTVQYLDILRTYRENAARVGSTMWILQLPVFVLLAAFIYMVARQMLEMEQNEIAMLKSRGASKRQVVLVYFLESTILAAISLVLGIPLAWLICRVLGASNAFMEFVGRTALPIQIDGTVLLYAGLAALLSILVMTIPAFRHAGVTIIEHKQRLRKKQTPFWQKTGLDLILLAVSVYGYYNYNNQIDLITERIAAGEALDPILFLNSALFIISAALLCLRLLPALTWLIFRLFRRWLSPALYASFLHILRTRKKQGFICAFIILTIAMGIFNANTARTINHNVEKSVRYEIGADLVLREDWASNANEQTSTADLVFYEPDDQRYANLSGYESLTKVFRDNDARMNIRGRELGSRTLQLMAINAKEFGETAWFPDDVLPYHWFNCLNALAQDSKAVLISQNLADNFSIALGDTITFSNSYGSTASGTVCGFITYWPGYNPVTQTIGADGALHDADQYLIVANYDQIVYDYGLLPYEFWFRLSGSSQFIYEFAAENDISYMRFHDVAAKLTEARNNTIYQVTNGLLTINFIVMLTLCAVGFLIYWVLSIQSRELLFGVYRAMGLSMREVISMLINEHVFISFLSAAAGILVGILSARLFVPLIQIAYTANSQILPTEIASSSEDTIRLAVVITTMFLLCIAVLGMLISKIKISQALKLGEE